MLLRLILCSGSKLIQVLRDAVMQWVIGSRPSYVIVIQDHMRSLVEHGIGYIKDVVTDHETFDAYDKYPVYIDEPLMVLSLMTLFEERDSTNRKTWLRHSLCSSRTKCSTGFIYEELAMMVFMEQYGGKFTALGDVFNFHAQTPLTSTEVRLVSLTRTDHRMSISEVSWTSGSSDCFGFKAQSVEDVLAFFVDPKGKCFLFPHNYMGPDVICFLQEKETSELIILLLQARARPKLDSKAWLKAVETVTPEFFYTMIVRVRHFTFYSLSHFLLHTER
jgi:hypothetical protein